MTTTCPEAPLGYGVSAFAATLSLTRFAASAETCGAYLAEGAGSPVPTEMDLADGTVSGCAIGACVQVDGYDIDRLSRNVSYSDNGSNLDVTTLPVPDLPMSSGAP